MNNRARYTLDEIQRNTFYQLPKFLFEGEFERLSNDARVLYSLLRDRHDLSIKNQWVNEDNQVYLIFSRENMGEMLSLSKPTVIKVMNELKKYNLIQEERLGQGQINRIYLLNVGTINPVNTGKSKIFTSTSKDFLPQQVKNFAPNDTEVNDTDSNETITSNPIPSVLEAAQEKIKTDTIRADENNAHGSSSRGTKKESLRNSPAYHSKDKLAKPSVKYDYNTVAEIIKSNIDYDYIIEDGTASEDILGEVVQVITSTICAEYKDGYISMGEEKMPAQAVKSVFFKLNMMDIQYFLESFARQTVPVTKLTPYIRASLFRNHGTIGHHYKNRVNVDMPQFAEK